MCCLLTSIFLVAYAAGLGQAAAATKPAASRADCTDPRNSRHRAQELIKYLNGLLDTAESRVEESAKAAEKLTVDAVVSSGKHKAKFAVLVGVAHDNAVTMAGVLSQNSPIFRQYLKLVTTLYNGYDAEARATQKSKEHTVTPVGGTHYGAATYTKQELTANVDTWCTTKTAEDTSPISAETLAKGQGLREPQLGIKPSHMCTNGGGACSGTTNTDIFTVTLNIGHTDAPATTGDAQASNTSKIPLAGTIKLTRVNKEKLEENHTVISAAVTALTGIPEAHVRETYTGHPQFTNLVGRLLLAIPAETVIAGTLTSKVDDEINKIFGGDQDTFNKHVWQDADKQPATYYGAKEAQAGNLKKLKENNHLGVALAVALGASPPAIPKCDASSEEVKAGIEKKETKAGDECKKHTTSEACKKEAGCDFDETKDPKCFPKAETEKKDENRFLAI
uniref:Variant surface glycoprotein 1252 n=1 Tax=Trypanosoma brucei TaxID=5691 RepID=M4SZQ2_9TRYP|nr:variant surface glycoprotein 1252 [Trypanosoma brucei]